MCAFVTPVESSQKASSHEMPKLSEDLKTTQRRLEEIESGDRGLTKLWSNLTEMNRKVNINVFCVAESGGEWYHSNQANVWSF